MKSELSVIEEAGERSEFSWIDEKVSEKEPTQLEDDNFPKRKREVKEDRKFTVNKHWKDSEIKQLTECLKKYGKDYEELEKAIPTRTRKSIADRIYKVKAGITKEQGESRKPSNFWTEEENDQLEQGLKLYGKNMLKLQEHLPNKNKKEI